MWISINKPKKISLKVAQDIWTSKSSGNKKVLLGTKNPRPYRDEIWIISSSPLTCVCVCGKYWHYGAVLFTLVHNESLSGNAELCKQLHYWFLLTLSHTFLKILSKSTWGKQPPRIFLNSLVYVCVYVFIYLCVTPPGHTNNDTDLKFGTYTPIDLI